MTWHDDVRARVAAATPAEWTVDYYGEGQYVVRMPRDRKATIDKSGQHVRVYGTPGIASGSQGGPIHGVPGHVLDGLTSREYDQQRGHDAYFIAHARTDLPRCLVWMERAALMLRAAITARIANKELPMLPSPFVKEVEALLAELEEA